MADYRSFFDRNWIAAFELAGADVTLTIARVEGVTVQSAGGSAERKIGLHFHETQKGMVSNTTNSATIASLYGTDTGQWVGKRITIFPTVTQFGREMKDCIRVRPGIPQWPPSPGGLFADAAPPPQGPTQTFSPGWPPPAPPAPAPPNPPAPPPLLGGQSFGTPGLHPGWEQSPPSMFAPRTTPSGYGAPQPPQQPWPPPPMHPTQGPMTYGGATAPGLQPGWAPEPTAPGYGPPPPVPQLAPVAPAPPATSVTPAPKRAAKGGRRAR
jgi:hypothetical protein